jgi:hypothetical protein
VHLLLEVVEGLELDRALEILEEMRPLRESLDLRIA